MTVIYRKAVALFNGASGMHVSQRRANLLAADVYYSEIDNFANAHAKQHFPNDTALGDVLNWRKWSIDWSQVDLITAGFPCQSWSMAGAQLGDRDERGKMFWVTLDIIEHALKHNPKVKWFMENVRMKEEFERYITYHTQRALGTVHKQMINSSLVAPQNRERYYWSNFPIKPPEPKHIVLRDILEPWITKVNHCGRTGPRPCYRIKSGHVGHVAEAEDVTGHDIISRIYGIDGKAPTLTTCGGGHREPKILIDDETYRKISPLEACRLQTFDDGLLEGFSATQVYKMAGNGWTIDVIVAILRSAYVAGIMDGSIDDDGESI